MTHVNTYGTDCILDKSSDHARACLADLVRKTRHTYMSYTDTYANERHVYEVRCTRVTLGRDGCTPGGTYYGVGLPLFSVNVQLRDASGMDYQFEHVVRAHSPAALRGELKRIFRNAKVGR